MSATGGLAAPSAPPEPPRPTGSATPALAVRALGKVYGAGETRVAALRGVDLVVERGEFVAIMGPSGSGKSTLMNLLGCLDTPSSGRYWLDGTDVSELDEVGLAMVRGRKLGFVFQSFHLIARMTALANVELPMAYARVPRGVRRERALAALELVGLTARAAHRPNQLSGGQQQRVAIARALVTSPAVVLADEPTGNLDTASTADVLDLFDSLHARGRTIVMITHEDEVAARAHRVVVVRDGRIVSDVRRPRDEPAPAGTAAAGGR